MGKKEKEKVLTVHTVSGFKPLTKKLIKESLGKEDPNKLLKWIGLLGENMKTMKFNPFHPKGTFFGSEMESELKKHYGEK